VLGIPNIIAFLTKHDLDDESKSLSASLLISIGSAAPVYASFAKDHGVFEALCSWGRSTDNERHHFKIQVAACISRCSPSRPNARVMATLTRCALQNCLQLFARHHSPHDAEDNTVLLLLHVCHSVTFRICFQALLTPCAAVPALLLAPAQPNIGIQSNSLPGASAGRIAPALAANTANPRCRSRFADGRHGGVQAGDV
jgi:hypothetical protein